jgi:prophage regulatory protein
MGKILRIRGVKTLTGLSKSTIYKYISDGLFPSQIKLGPRTVGWLEEDIELWLTSRIVSRDI